MAAKPQIEFISVILPENPFVKKGGAQACLCVLDVEKLMQWWPGLPHFPHRNAAKVKSIQRSLDWKRVAQIAAYLLQKELEDISERLDKYFGEIYQPKKNEPGREWPPKVGRVISYSPSVYPTFSNILVHANGVELRHEPKKDETGAQEGTLLINPESRNLKISVIDGQHRINGAYLAVKILQEENPATHLDIPAEVFVDLDPAEGPPEHQAQIFIDVNLNQKKVDRSLVADLFPTTRGGRASTDNKERAQDIGRKLMLEKGPLVGMIQIPGIKYGVKDVIALSTLVGAIEDSLDYLYQADLTSMGEQSDFIAQALNAWLEATGRREDAQESKKLSEGNVVYQGRILVSVISLIPAMIWHLRNKGKWPLISNKSEEELTRWFAVLIKNAGLMEGGRFIGRDEFKEEGYLGSGGIGRFRDRLWASVVPSKKKISRRTRPEKVSQLAEQNRATIFKKIGVT